MRFGRRAQIAIELAALTLLGFLAATFLAGLVPFYRLGAGPYWLFLFGVGAVIALIAWFTTDRAGVTTLIVALGILVGLIVSTSRPARGCSSTRCSATRRRSPGRFAGLGNLGYAQLAAGAVLLAGLRRVPHRRPARRARSRSRCSASRSSSTARRSSAPTSAACSRWCPRTRSPRRCCSAGSIRWKLVALYGAATVVLLALFAAIDLTPPGEQAHAPRAADRVGRGRGRLPQRVDADPAQALGEHRRSCSARSGRSCSRSCSPASRTSSTARRAACAACTSASRSSRPRWSASAIVIVLGTALNDSGIAIAGVMLGVMTPVLVVVTMRGDRARPALGDLADRPSGPPTSTDPPDRSRALA